MDSGSSITRGICLLSNPEKGIKGYVKFEDNNYKTKISVEIIGLPKGKHGIHIHEFGNLTSGCQSAGVHYNPFKKDHGGPNNENRHVGDIGNIEADDNGNAYLKYEDDLIKLSGEFSILGRSVVVHELEDDLGKVKIFLFLGKSLRLFSDWAFWRKISMRSYRNNKRVLNFKFNVKIKIITLKLKKKNNIIIKVF